MPTGYTSALYDGDDQTFPEFLLSCARAMGALITMRDDSPSAPIPDEFTASSYHADKEADARREGARLLALTADEAQAEATAARQAWEAQQTASEAERVARKGRYEAMLAKARAWEPPTKNHVGLRDFMVEQLEQSIDFDCSHHEFNAPTSDGPTWLAAAIAKANRDIAYHAEEYAKEAERASERSAWVRALRASLSDREVSNDG
jgi:hypothetical protein